jgi:two-component system cell cycle response regulator CpdR
MARILVAENNKTVAGYICASLKKGCHLVDLTDNALDTWRASGTTAYDALIIDVMMPGIDGFVLAQRALQENPHLQVIFVTGFAAVAMDTYATPAYAPAPLTLRPFHLRMLNTKLRMLFGYGGAEEMPAPTGASGMVVYADFSRKPAPAAPVQETAQV